MILNDVFSNRTLYNITKYIFWMMILLLVFCFILEVYLITEHHSFPDLHASSPDEAAFLEWAGPTGFHFGSAYGPVFWSFLSLIMRFFPQEYLILVARILFASMKYIAWLLVAFSFVDSKLPVSSLKAQTRESQSLSLEINYVAPILFLFCLLTTPGYFFFGKIISPEYMLMLFPALTFFFLYKDRLRFGRNYFFAIFFAMMTAATKLSGWPFMFIIAAYGPIYLFVKGNIFYLFFGCLCFLCVAYLIHFMPFRVRFQSFPISITVFLL
jgi:hypothetical protein